MLYADNAALFGTCVWTPTLGDLLKRDAATDWKPPTDIFVHLHYFVGTTPDPTGEAAIPD